MNVICMCLLITLSVSFVLHSVNDSQEIYIHIHIYVYTTHIYTSAHNRNHVLGHVIAAINYCGCPLPPLVKLYYEFSV